MLAFDGVISPTCLVVYAMRAAWPQDKPLFVRVSSVDGVEGAASGAATMNRLAQPRLPGAILPLTGLAPRARNWRTSTV